MIHSFASSQLKDTLLAEMAPPPSESAGCGAHPFPHLHRRLHDTSLAVGTFINGTLLYVLSREWQDLLAVNVLHLHPCDSLSTHEAVVPTNQPPLPPTAQVALLRHSPWQLVSAAVHGRGVLRRAVPLRRELDVHRCSRAARIAAE